MNSYPSSFSLYLFLLLSFSCSLQLHWCIPPSSPIRLLTIFSILFKHSSLLPTLPSPTFVLLSPSLLPSPVTSTWWTFEVFCPPSPLLPQQPSFFTTEPLTVPSTWPLCSVTSVGERWLVCVRYSVDSSLVVLSLVLRLMSSWCTQMEREVAWGPRWTSGFKRNKLLSKTVHRHDC